MLGPTDGGGTTSKTKWENATAIWNGYASPLGKVVVKAATTGGAAYALNYGLSTANGLKAVNYVFKDVKSASTLTLRQSAAYAAAISLIFQGLVKWAPAKTVGLLDSRPNLKATLVIGFASAVVYLGSQVVTVGTLIKKAEPKDAAQLFVASVLAYHVAKQVWKLAKYGKDKVVALWKNYGPTPSTWTCKWFSKTGKAADKAAVAVTVTAGAREAFERNLAQGRFWEQRAGLYATVSAEKDLRIQKLEQQVQNLMYQVGVPAFERPVVAVATSASSSSSSSNGLSVHERARQFGDIVASLTAKSSLDHEDAIPNFAEFQDEWLSKPTPTPAPAPAPVDLGLAGSGTNTGHDSVVEDQKEKPKSPPRSSSPGPESPEPAIGSGGKPAKNSKKSKGS